ncbi:NO-binding membrane sensor protein with MHYT domain [Amycolatopsis bartoniae]|uniref:MHYT domain-containing signal sensor n=2 Tax=Amycolatopsis bartoniae TaxID=941986 RepID=A0A8H9MDG6_9PSEU|nr:NO-binding membrane sensor protein with MHYT domain [Amycolatopsis bartoniae]GHF79223.1 MHYT domain-containing signal sensor [Amycolatopsis bartoniae]
MDMTDVQHFALGDWLLLLAYLTSVVGCTVGLSCTLQARYALSARSRLSWLALAALSIGGVGIWLMHFVAMLGFSTPGMPVRYNVFWTVLSAVLAVVSVFGGLLVFGVRTRFAWWRLIAGGVITGLAVNLMHYTGMWGLEVKGSIGYQPGLVVLSVVIAVVAATAALWFTVAVDKPLHRLAAGLVAGIAVTGMHYTGMAAMRVHLDMGAPDPAGVEVFSFLFPVFVLAAVALAVPICAVLMAPPPGSRRAPVQVPAKQPA